MAVPARREAHLPRKWASRLRTGGLSRPIRSPSSSAWSARIIPPSRSSFTHLKKLSLPIAAGSFLGAIGHDAAGAVSIFSSVHIQNSGLIRGKRRQLDGEIVRPA